jgi:hypothetical protein
MENQEVPEFLQKMAAESAKQAGAGFGMMVGLLAAGYKHLRGAGMTRRDSIEVLLSLMGLLTVSLGAKRES